MSTEIDSSENAFNKKDGILLDSGTNEVEMLEFDIGKTSYGVNVSKVKRLLQYEPKNVTQLPNNNGKIKELITIQNQTTPFVRLCEVLKVKPNENLERNIVILLGFNNISVAILVDSIREIHRMNWNQFQPISEYLPVHNNIVLGTFNKNSNDILVLDFEKIMADFFPETDMETMIKEEKPKSVTEVRSFRKIFHVDDSKTIRSVFSNTLKKSGYTKISSFTNGEECYHFLKTIKEKIDSKQTSLSDEVNAMVIDIEMPQMDGLTLCKRIRQEFGWNKLPIILFSSLVDDQMIEKCKSVGATTQIAKPDIVTLVDLLDKFIIDTK